MPQSELFKWQLESAQKYDDSERSLGDVLDVKASVALVAVTFLAGISGQLIAMQGLPPLWSKIQLCAQCVALILLSIAGSLLIFELWPRDYVASSTPKQDADWIANLKSELPTEEDVCERVLPIKLERAIARVESNKAINTGKSKLIADTFQILAWAIALVFGNLLFLGARAIWPLLGGR